MGVCTKKQMHIRFCKFLIVHFPFCGGGDSLVPFLKSSITASFSECLLYSFQHCWSVSFPSCVLFLPEYCLFVSACPLCAHAYRPQRLLCFWRWQRTSDFQSLSAFRLRARSLQRYVYGTFACYPCSFVLFFFSS